MSTVSRSTERLVGTALLAALVLLLQFFVSIPLGAFTVTLTLVPIMLGAILYGPTAGALLGGVFGVAVSIQVITGAAGVMSTQMLQMAPVVTIAVCILKGVLAGLGAGAVHKLLRRKNNTVAVLLSAISCPLINTGLFTAALFLFYYDLLVSYAAANALASAFAFVFVGVLGLNFVVEFLVNVLLVPVVLRVMAIVTHGKHR